MAQNKIVVTKVGFDKINIAGNIDSLRREALGEIGQMLIDSTHLGMNDMRAPDGSPHAPLSPVTIAKKGHSRTLFDSGRLFGSIQIISQTDDTVKVGPSTPDEQRKAITQQFAGVMPKAAPGRPIKRPFLGISEYRGDMEKAVSIVERIIGEALQ